MLCSEDLTLLLCLQHAVVQQRPLSANPDCDNLSSRSSSSASLHLWCVESILERMSAQGRPTRGKGGCQRIVLEYVNRLNRVVGGDVDNDDQEVRLQESLSTLEEIYRTAAIAISGPSAFSSFCQADDVFKLDPTKSGAMRKRLAVIGGGGIEDGGADERSRQGNNTYCRNSSFGGRYSSHNRQKSEQPSSPWRHAPQPQGAGPPNISHHQGTAPPTSTMAMFLNLQELAPIDCLVREYFLWMRLAKDGLTFEQLGTLLDRVYTEWTTVFTATGAAPLEISTPVPTTTTTGGEADDAPGVPVFETTEARLNRLQKVFDESYSSQVSSTSPSAIKYTKMEAIEMAIQEKDVTTATRLIYDAFDVTNPVLPSPDDYYDHDEQSSSCASKGEESRPLSRGGVLENPNRTLAPVAPISVPERLMLGGNFGYPGRGVGRTPSTNASIPVATAYSMMCLSDLSLETGGLRAAKSCADLAVLLARQVTGASSSNTGSNSGGTQESVILIAAHYNRCKWCLRAGRPDAATEDLSIVIQLTEPRGGTSSSGQKDSSNTVAAGNTTAAGASTNSATTANPLLPQSLVKFRAMGLLSLAEVIAYFPDSVEESLRDNAARTSQEDLLTAVIGKLDTSVASSGAAGSQSASNNTGKNTKQSSQQKKSMSSGSSGLLIKATSQIALDCVKMARETCLFLLDSSADGSSSGKIELLRAVETLELELSLWGLQATSVLRPSSAPSVTADEPCSLLSSQIQHIAAKCLLQTQKQNSVEGLSTLISALGGSSSRLEKEREGLLLLVEGGDVESFHKQSVEPLEKLLAKCSSSAMHNLLDVLISHTLFSTGYVSLARKVLTPCFSSVLADARTHHPGSSALNLLITAALLGFEIDAKLGSLTCASKKIDVLESLVSQSRIKFLPIPLAIALLRSRWHLLVGDRPKAHAAATELALHANKLGFHYFAAEAHLQLESIFVSKTVASISARISSSSGSSSSVAIEPSVSGSLRTKDDEEIEQCLEDFDATNVLRLPSSSLLNVKQRSRQLMLSVWLRSSILKLSGLSPITNSSSNNFTSGGSFYPSTPGLGRRGRYLSLSPSVVEHLQMTFIEDLAALSKTLNLYKKTGVLTLETLCLHQSLRFAGFIPSRQSHQAAAKAGSGNGGKENSSVNNNLNKPAPGGSSSRKSTTTAKPLTAMMIRMTERVLQEIDNNSTAARDNHPLSTSLDEITTQRAKLETW